MTVDTYGVRGRAALLLLIVSLLALLLVLWSMMRAMSGERPLELVFLDVGQGDSILIRAPSGITALIDGGPSGVRTLRALSRHVPFWQRRIDIVIATHPDADHIGGLIDIVRRYRVGMLVRPGVKHDTPATESLLQSIARARTAHTREHLARRGQVYTLGTDARGREVLLRILYPDRDVAGVDTNMASIVLTLEYGKTHAMLTGDAPQEVERYIVSLDGDSGRLNSAILKLGHHGSRTSSSLLWLGYVSPQWAIVSAGADNRYGHPHAEVLARAQALGAEIKNTAKQGDIVFTSDGERWIPR